MNQDGLGVIQETERLTEPENMAYPFVDTLKIKVGGTLIEASTPLL